MAKVWPFSELQKKATESGSNLITDTFNDQPITINFDPISKTAIIHDIDGKLLPAVRAFWFAWYSFYPDTEVYIAR